MACSNEDSHVLLVCDACQHAMGHRLPYLISTSVSSFPFELVVSDVCEGLLIILLEGINYVSLLVILEKKII